MALLPIIKDPIDRKKRRKWLISKFNWVAYAIIGLFIVGVCLGLWKERRDKQEKDRENEAFIQRIESLKSTIDQFNNDPTEKVNSGLGFSGVVRIGESPDNRRKFILDGGGLNENRVSLYLDFDNNLIFRVIDKNGETYSVKAQQNFITFKKGAYYFFYCDVGYSDNYSFIRLYLDDREIAKQEFSNKIDMSSYSQKDSTVRFGSDIEGKNNGKFTVSFFSISAPMSRKQIFSYMRIISNYLQETKAYE